MEGRNNSEIARRLQAQQSYLMQNPKNKGRKPKKESIMRRLTERREGHE